MLHGAAVVRVALQPSSCVTSVTAPWYCDALSSWPSNAATGPLAATCLGGAVGSCTSTGMRGQAYIHQLRGRFVVRHPGYTN